MTGLIVVMIAAGVHNSGCCPCLLPDADSSVPATVPSFCAARFSNPTQIDSSYFPLVPGTTLTYSGETAEGEERTVYEVTGDTRSVLGVTCRVVRDRVYLDDVLIEDTHDWFAQDDDGNVWYMGEDVDNYNYDEQGALIDITHEGAWEAGMDVSGIGVIARPGHYIRANPAIGDPYHQEYYAGEAEDVGEVVAVDVQVTLSDNSTYTCIQTRDYSSLDPALNEYKYYAPGVGVVLTELVVGGERTELTGIEGP